MPPTSELMKLTTPRTRGQAIQGYFSESGVILRTLYTMRPSVFLTAMATRPGPCIITPSMTACPPTEMKPSGCLLKNQSWKRLEKSDMVSSRRIDFRFSIIVPLAFPRKHENMTMP